MRRFLIARGRGPDRRRLRHIAPPDGEERSTRAIPNTPPRDCRQARKAVAGYDDNKDGRAVIAIAGNLVVPFAGSAAALAMSKMKDDEREALSERVRRAVRVRPARRRSGPRQLRDGRSAPFLLTGRLIPVKSGRGASARALDNGVGSRPWSSSAARASCGSSRPWGPAPASPGSSSAGRTTGASGRARGDRGATAVESRSLRR